MCTQTYTYKCTYERWLLTIGKEKQDKDSHNTSVQGCSA